MRGDVLPYVMFLGALVIILVGAFIAGIRSDATIPASNYITVVVDGCEYIHYWGHPKGITHKANCTNHVMKAEAK